uniref:MULE transposase domain-containing protein n=1 Tax=Ditylenchus dipsaci TaxID=166011 RepID=A0A915E0E2_9BILA
MDLQMNAIRQLLAANGDYSEDEEFADELSVNEQNAGEHLVNEENAVQHEQIVEAVEEVEQPVETVPSQKSNLKLVYDRHLFVFQSGTSIERRSFGNATSIELTDVQSAFTPIFQVKSFQQRSQHYSPEPGTWELFLLGDSNDKDRILMFGRSYASTWIHKVRKIYIDGTFRIAPHHFYQIFVIIGERQGFVLPLLYALLPNKSEACYMKMFEMIKTLWPRFRPTSASLDYEMGLINAVKESFVGISLGGCLFHLSKNMKLHLGNNPILPALLQAKMSLNATYEVKKEPIDEEFLVKHTPEVKKEATNAESVQDSLNVSKDCDLDTATDDFLTSALALLLFEFPFICLVPTRPVAVADLAFNEVVSQQVLSVSSQQHLRESAGLDSTYTVDKNRESPTTPESVNASKDDNE